MVSKLTQVLAEIELHIAKCGNDKYEKSPIDPKPFINSIYGKGFNIGNAVKYLSRYCATDGNKCSQREDLLKAVHYIIFELERSLEASKPLTEAYIEKPLINKKDIDFDLELIGNS